MLAFFAFWKMLPCDCPSSRLMLRLKDSRSELFNRCPPLVWLFLHEIIAFWKQLKKKCPLLTPTRRKTATNWHGKEIIMNQLAFAFSVDSKGSPCDVLTYPEGLLLGTVRTSEWMGCLGVEDLCWTGADSVVLKRHWWPWNYYSTNVKDKTMSHLAARVLMKLPHTCS